MNISTFNISLEIFFKSLIQMKFGLSCNKDKNTLQVFEFCVFGEKGGVREEKQEKSLTFKK